ncbi:MAG: DUF4911 domain-containing protein [Desulfobacterales bacterium]
MQTKQQYYRVDRREIAFIKFVYEAYDGIAALRTIDPQKGIILFYIAPGCERQFEDILQDLSSQILIRPLKALSCNRAHQHQ